MMKKITFILTLFLTGFLANYTFAQGSCATAVPLTPGTQQCGDTSSGADIYDNNTCLGSYDGGDDYIFSYVATATGETLTLDLTGVDAWTGFAMSDDCPDATTYNCMGSATTSSAGSINFTSSPLTSGVTYYIHISTWPSPQNTAFCLDAVVNPAPTCLDPDTFAVNNITTTSADLSWNDPSGVQFDFEYVIQAQGTGMPAASGTPVSAMMVTDNTLTANTPYEAWVRAYCGGTDYSAWVGPINFTTLCNAFTAPWTYDVESAVATTNSSISDCWSSNPTGTTAAYRWNVDASGSTPSTNTGPTGAYSGINYFYVEASSGVSGDIAELYTPLVDISALTTPTLQFYYHMFGSTMGDLHVDVFDGSVWVDDVDVISGQQQTAQADPWLLRVVDLSAYTGAIQVRFRGIRSTDYFGDISLDDITFAEAPSCYAPTGLAVSNITNNSADLTWTDGSGGTQFDFYYVIQPQGTGTAGITVENYYDYSNGVPFTATCTDISNCGTTLLTSNTAYEVYVRDDCGGAWVGPVNFTTLCDAFTAPFLESFETNTFPACWFQGGATTWEYGSSATTPTGFAAYGAANVPDHSVSGAGTFIGMDGSDNTDGEVSTLTTPLVDISGLTSPYLSYYVFSNNVDDTAQNELMVEFYDGSAWTTVETIQANLGTNWVLYGVDLTTFTITGDVQARFTVTGVANGGSTFYNDILIDDVSFDEAPTCFAPTGLAVSNITNNSADIAWTDGSGGTQFDFYYVIQPQGTGTAGITVENYYDYSNGVPFTATCTDISNCGTTLLTSNTTYEVYVRDDCGGAWVGPVNFTTLCSAFTAPWTYDVESAVATTNSSISDCWSSNPTGTTSAYRWNVDASGSTPSTNTGPTGAYSGINYFYVEASSGVSGDIAELYTPSVDISALTTPTLQFYYHMFGSTMGDLHVDVFDGSVWVDDVDVISGQQQTAQADPWLLRVVDLSAYTGTIQVRFRGIRSTDYFGDISLDDITFAEAPSCYAPTGLAVSNVSTTSADITWTDASGGSQFDFYYVIQPQGTGTAGITVENYYDYSNGVPFTATCTDISNCGTTLLTPGTAYEVYVRDDCGGAWVGPINFTTNFEVVCGTPVNTTYCYTNNDTTTWTFTSSTGDPLRITFNAGGIESCCDDILIYDGTDNSGTLLYQGNNGGDLTGLTFDSTSDSIYIEIDSDGSVSCSSGSTCCTSQWDFDVTCATCVNPTVNYTVVPDCGNGQYSIDVDVTDLGTATSVTITDGTTTLTNISATGVQSFGPYADGASVTIDITNEQDSNCSVSSGALSYVCPPANDNLCGAIPLTVGAPATGNDYTLVGATAETNEPVPTCFNGGINGGSVWFSFVAPSTSVEVTTDFAGGTLEDGDTEIAVYDATGVTCSDLSTLPADIDCDQDSGNTNTLYGSYLILTGLTPGTTYYIQVDMYGGINAGTFGIQVNDLLSTNNFDSNSFVAYPNPVKDELTLEYSNEISNVTIFNMLGQEVLSRAIDATSTQIDMSQLSAGTYLVNVTSGDIQKTIKVVKQ